MPHDPQDIGNLYEQLQRDYHAAVAANNKFRAALLKIERGDREEYTNDLGCYAKIAHDALAETR